MKKEVEGKYGDRTYQNDLNTNVLFIIFLDDSSGEGLRALNGLLARASSAELAVYADGKRNYVRASGRPIDVLPPGFNVVDGTISIPNRAEPVEGRTVLQVRYRPAASSTAWAPLVFPDHRNIKSADDQMIWSMFMSMRPFERESGQTRKFGCFEVFGSPLPERSTDEKGVFDFLDWVCPELLRCDLWGASDYLPFRELTVEEEWEAAKGPLLWSDLSLIEDSWHQYLFKTAGATPATQVSSTGLTYGPLTVYKLARPSWA